MVKITLEQIKKLRLKTKAGVLDCRQALEESRGDLTKAEKWLRKKGIEAAAKKEGRETKHGWVGAYSHHDGTKASLVALACETDFVARTQEFKTLVQEIAMQVTAMAPKDVKTLLKQPWIRDESRTIADLLKEMTAKTGENIVLKDFKRVDLK
ncbi:MAG: translation elongation factor Ts [Candidatus Marinimicrobia bacterium]|nr:translation elongation factor Ts [Candidatus Neomarinimicrobiota bacterium]